MEETTGTPLRRRSTRRIQEIASSTGPTTSTERPLAPPLPPPPYPPPPSEDDEDDEDYVYQEEEDYLFPEVQDREAQTDDEIIPPDEGIPQPVEPWILRIRPNHQPLNNHNHAPLPPMLLLRIDHTSTEESLAASLQQLCSLPISGLVSEQSGIFLSLSQILYNEPSPHDVYLLKPRIPQPPTPKSSTSIFSWELIIGLLIILVAVLFLIWGDGIAQLTFLTVTSVYEVIVQIPLRELYRYGPWVIGWEGEALSSICARITYHGDAVFWSRNMEECERIYQLKEEAFLRITRPIVYLLTFLVLVYLVRITLQELRESRKHKRQHSPVDREMLETYRAMNTLAGFFRRHLDPPAPRRPESKDRRN